MLSNICLLIIGQPSEARMPESIVIGCANGEHVPDSPARRSDCASPRCVECFSTLCMDCQTTAVLGGSLSLCDVCSMKASKALDEIIASEQDQHRSELREHERPKNSSKRWSDEEAQQLLLSYRSGQPVLSIARQHGRSVGAIWCRLIRAREVSWSQVPETYRPFGET